MKRKTRSPEEGEKAVDGRRHEELYEIKKK